MAKYLTKYQALYSPSPILLLKSPPLLLCWTPLKILTAVAPAIPITKSIFPDASSLSVDNPTLLIHLLSNGGSSSISGLYTAYDARGETERRYWWLVRNIWEGRSGGV